jgi:bifunctional non-homologous end joining protein LigD
VNRSVDVEGRRLAVTNLDKVLWPETGTTKAELIEYYAAVAPTLLPHLEGRPLTIRRFPDGVEGVSWHQNECQGEPDWFPVFETTGRGGRRLRFCMVDGLSSLVWLANQAAVELHPFLWRAERPRQPTQIVVDLDPGPPAGLVECARVDTKRLARELAERLADQRPDEVVAEMKRTARAGKVFVDWLQNDVTRQTVAPYSLRGLAWPTVATPLAWEEVERCAEEGRAGLLVFTPADALERIERQGDLFAPLR